MTEEQFEALCELIETLAQKEAVEVVGRTVSPRAIEQAKQHARMYLVDPEST